MEKTPPPKRLRYDIAFRAEALRLARESCSAQAADRTLNIRPEMLYWWQRVVQAPLPTDPAKVWALRTVNKELTQEIDILTGLTHFRVL